MLGDENLLEAFQTIFGITLNTNGNIDNNASIVSRLMPMSDLTNSKKLDQLVERFCAQYTVLYSSGGTDASSPLEVYNSGTTATSSSLDAATSIMSSIVSGNSSYGGSSTTQSLSSVLLNSLQSLSLGG